LQEQTQPSTEQAPQEDHTSAPAPRDVPGARESPLSWRFAMRLVIAALVGVLAVWLVANLQTLLMELFLAIVLVTGLSSMTRGLQSLGLPRLVAILLIVAVALALVAIFGVFVIPALLGQTATFVKQLPHLSQGTESQLQQVEQRFPSLPPLAQELRSMLGALGSALLGAASALVGSAANLVGATIFVSLITVYLLVDGLHIREYVLSLLPLRYDERTRSVMDCMGERIGRWLVGQTVLSLSFGVISFVLLTALGVPGALPLAVLGALSEIMPNIGGFLAGAAAVLVALTQSPLLALWTALGYLVLTQVDGFLLTPKVMGKAVHLHPLAIILALFVGGKLLGALGVLIAIPLTAALAVLVDEVRSAHRRAAETLRT
jgi:predicted PurR-regulated permease PerM